VFSTFYSPFHILCFIFPVTCSPPHGPHFVFSTVLTYLPLYIHFYVFTVDSLPLCIHRCISTVTCALLYLVVTRLLLCIRRSIFALMCSPCIHRDVTAKSPLLRRQIVYPTSFTASYSPLHVLCYLFHLVFPILHLHFLLPATCSPPHPPRFPFSASIFFVMSPLCSPLHLPRSVFPTSLAPLCIHRYVPYLCVVKFT